MESSPSAPADPQPEPQADWGRTLPREAFGEIIVILRGALPPPATDAPRDWARRDRAALAAVAALLPANAAEGKLAAQFVAADAWAMDCLRLAAERGRELEIARKARAQAVSLMRESKSALRLLAKLQEARQATEKDEAASIRAAWAEHAAVGMMEEALSPVPPAGPAARQDPDPPPPAAAAEGAAGKNVVKFGPDAKPAIQSRESRHETEARISPLGFGPLRKVPGEP